MLRFPGYSIFLRKKSHGGTKAHDGSPTQHTGLHRNRSDRDHPYATMLAFIFVTFKVHVLYQLK